MSESKWPKPIRVSGYTVHRNHITYTKTYKTFEEPNYAVTVVAIKGNAKHYRKLAAFYTACAEAAE